MTTVQQAPQANSAVRNNRAKKRFELEADGDVAIAEYAARSPGMLAFTHTFTPPRLRGRGIAARLVQGALEQVRAEGFKVIPQCWYVADYIDNHPEFSDLLAER